MNATISPKSVNAVIISSYNYDHPYTDMACAWSTVYKIFEIDSRVIRSIDCVSGCGETLDSTAPELNIVKMTDEIKTLYNETLTKKREENFISQRDKFQKELDEYNALMRPQKKGQVVEITSGRSKGYTGTVTWFGKNKFNTSYSSRGSSLRAAALLAYISQKPYEIPNKENDLIAIRPLESETFPNGKSVIYIDPSKAKVISGYEVIEINDSRLRQMLISDESFTERWRNAY